MPYIGHNPTNAGSFIEVDDFASSFNGSNVAFTLQVGGVDITPNQQNLLVVLDGVLQMSGSAYSVSGSTITFTGAPASGVDLYCVLMGQSASIGQGTIGADELKISGNGTSGQLIKSDGDGTFSYLSTTSITSVGTIGTGVWQGTAIASAYLDADTAHLSGSTFTGSVQISHGTTPDFTLNDTGGTTNKRVFRIAGGGDGIYFEGRNNDNSGDGSAGLMTSYSLDDGTITHHKLTHLKGSAWNSILRLGDTSRSEQLTHMNNGSVNFSIYTSNGTKGVLTANHDGSAMTLGADYASGTLSVYAPTTFSKNITLNTSSHSTLLIKGASGCDAEVAMQANNNADNEDQWSINVKNSDSSKLHFATYGSGSWTSPLVLGHDSATFATRLTLSGDGSGDGIFMGTGWQIFDNASESYGSTGSLVFFNGDSRVEMRENGTLYMAGGLQSGATLLGTVTISGTQYAVVGSNSSSRGIAICRDGSASYPDFRIESNGNININGQITVGSDVINNGNIYSNGTSGSHYLGLSNRRWHTVFSVNTDFSSDQTLKKNIKTSDLGIDFINSLNPVKFNWKKSFQDDSKNHYGFLAQEIAKTALADSVNGDEGEMGMNYIELIAPIVKAIQELSNKVTALEGS